MEEKNEKLKNLEIINSLENELNLIEPKLREWNFKYFNNHKNRYLSDLDIISKYYKGGRIIEVGSAPYHLIYCLQRKGLNVIGVDLDPVRGSKFIDKNLIKIYKCNIEEEKLPFDDDTFSFVILNEVFEHLRINPIFALKEIHRVTKNNGFLLLTTPNLYSLSKILFFNIGKGFNDPYDEFEKLYTLGHAGHIREYSNREIRKFLNNTGFKTINVEYKYYKKEKGKITLKIIFKSMIYNIFPKVKPTQIVIARVEK